MACYSVEMRMARLQSCAPAGRAAPRARLAATQLLAGRVTARRGRPRPLRIAPLSVRAADLELTRSGDQKHQRSSTIHYPLHATPPTNSSSPTPSPYPCEPSVRPGTLPAPLNRPGAVFLPQLRPKAPPWALHVARPPPCFSTTSEQLDEVVLSPLCSPTLPLVSNERQQAGNQVSSDVLYFQFATRDFARQFEVLQGSNCTDRDSGE